ncbi:tRNA dimethylallyltransferase [Trichinella pseudospiralis]
MFSEFRLQLLKNIERMEQRKNKNSDDTVQNFMDATKQMKRKQEIWIRKKRKSENADDTKQNSGMKTYEMIDKLFNHFTFRK